VVDDASPVPAQGEVDAAALPETIGLQVITQANGGPGAARNTGLDAVPPGTRYVAFLDSDDEWSAEHLARGVAALEPGYDFYFADHYQLGQTIGAFDRAGRMRIADHSLLPTVQAGLYAFRGDLFDQVLRGNVIGTSTVMYRWADFADVRFHVEFTKAGEDYLFWMTLARRGARAAFSAQVEATYGKGVNVYSGSGWGTDGHLLLLHQEICFRHAISQLFEVSDEQANHLQSELRRLRKAFARELLHRLRHRKQLPLRLLWRHFRSDARSFTGLPAAAVSISRDRD
jgi:succinoglycan biosynthesis protein ExoW